MVTTGVTVEVRVAGVQIGAFDRQRRARVADVVLAGGSGHARGLDEFPQALVGPQLEVWMTAERREPLLGELDLLPATPADPQARWEPAAGQGVSESGDRPLIRLLETNQATDGAVPNLPPVGPGGSYFIAASGPWPFAYP
jgi:hypothetical protein